MTETPNETSALLADGRPVIRCSCGFLAISGSEAQNLIAFKRHHCGSAAVGRRWHESVFSENGYLLIAGIVTCAAIVLVSVFA